VGVGVSEYLTRPGRGCKSGGMRGGRKEEGREGGMEPLLGNALASPQMAGPLARGLLFRRPPARPPPPEFGDKC